MKVSDPITNKLLAIIADLEKDKKLPSKNAVIQATLSHVHFTGTPGDMKLVDQILNQKSSSGIMVSREDVYNRGAAVDKDCIEGVNCDETEFVEQEINLPVEEDFANGKIVVETEVKYTDEEFVRKNSDNPLALKNPNQLLIYFGRGLLEDIIVNKAMKAFAKVSLDQSIYDKIKNFPAKSNKKIGEMLFTMIKEAGLFEWQTAE